MKDMVEDSITNLVDQSKLAQVQEAEDMEKIQLQKWVESASEASV